MDVSRIEALENENSRLRSALCKQEELTGRYLRRAEYFEDCITGKDGWQDVCAEKDARISDLEALVVAMRPLIAVPSGIDERMAALGLTEGDR